MLAFAPSLVALGVALVSLAESQMPPGSTTESQQRIITVAGTVAENGISSETPENRNSTLMSSTVSYTSANGNQTEGASSETTPPPMSTPYTHATKMTESQRDKSTTTAKPSTAKSYDTTGILIVILIIVVAIGFGIACYISKRRARRYAVDFPSRAEEASVPLSPMEPMLANDSAPHNGLQTFESGDKRSKEEEREGEAPKQDKDKPKAEAEAESASPPADDSQNKAKEAKPVKTDEPGQQISEGTAEESPQNENNSNNSDMMQRKGDMSDREAAVKSFVPRQLKVQGTSMAL